MTSDTDIPWDVDKFATLFSPATPRASPSLEKQQQQQESITTPSSSLYHNNYNHAKRSPLPRDSDHEFGSFVSVPAVDDPLGSGGGVEAGYYGASTSAAAAGVVVAQLIDFDSPALDPSSLSASNQQQHAGNVAAQNNTTSPMTNASLDFFDKFGREAKLSSEKSRHSVLDELLMHEDDPLYWLSSSGVERDGAGEVGGASASEGGDEISAIGEEEDGRQRGGQATPPPLSIDHSPQRLSPPLPLPRSPSRTRHYSPRPSLSPTRSSTLALPMTLAPPLADKSTAAADPSSSSSSPPSSSSAATEYSTSTSVDVNSIGINDDNPNTNFESQRPSSSMSSMPPASTPSSFTSSPYSTLTNLSSRWVTTFLSSSSSSSPHTKPQPRPPASFSSSLEALFASDAANESMTSSTSRREREQKQKQTREVAHDQTRIKTSADRPLPHELPQQQQQQQQRPSHPYQNLHRTSSSSSSSRSLTPTNSSTTTSHPVYHIPSSHIPPVQITHGTPFGRSTTMMTGTGVGAGTTPFGAHVYIPPSGAPGYRGEVYDWDKGYSEELVRELSQVEVKADVGEAEGRGRGRERGKGNGNGNGNGKGLGVKSQLNVIDLNGVEVLDVRRLIEKKGGIVELSGRRASTMVVLEVELADMIRTHLPALARLSKTWTLVYSLDQHGISLNTLYERCEQVFIQDASSSSSGSSGSVPKLASLHVAAPAGALVVVKDETGMVFGASVGREGVRRSKGRGYYGSGESFLWKYVDGKLKVFKWTGKNEYVALCEPEFISFGGGDGNYGLYLDDTLFEGSSAPCPTFDNEPLCERERQSSGKVGAGARVANFECVGLEVWRIGA